MIRIRHSQDFLVERFTGSCQVVGNEIQRGTQRNSPAIGSVAGQSIEGIRHGADASPRMHFVAGDLHGIARAVDMLVMLVDHHQLAPASSQLRAQSSSKPNCGCRWKSAFSLRLSRVLR